MIWPLGRGFGSTRDHRPCDHRCGADRYSVPWPVAVLGHL